MLSHFEKPRPEHFARLRSPRIFAIFSFRYDCHLVPDLIRNIEPIVDGWIAFDDRAAEAPFSSEPARHMALVNRARELGVDWILSIDPDERLETATALRIRALVAHRERIIWTFNLRELFSPTKYRIDGIWGRKRVGRLFPLLDGQVFSQQELHTPKYPIEPGYTVRSSDLNLYHLKMIDPERRKARRDLYHFLDPQNKYQAFGYDYMTDESGAKFEVIEKDRTYAPPHRDDGGLWVASTRMTRPSNVERS